MALPVRYGALALYVFDVWASYSLQREFWTQCTGDAYSDSLLPWLVSGPILLAAVAIARFRPTWLWITAMIVALPAGYIICAWIENGANSAAPTVC